MGEDERIRCRNLERERGRGTPPARSDDTLAPFQIPGSIRPRTARTTLITMPPMTAKQILQSAGVNRRLSKPNAGTNTGTATKYFGKRPACSKLSLPGRPPAIAKFIQQAAQGTKLPESVVAAQNYAESGYGSNLGPSSAGAEGPWQFEPSTYTGLGFSLGTINDWSDSQHQPTLSI